MAKTTCKAVKTGKSKTRGTASLEWIDKDGTKHFYCYGYNDASTDTLIQVCRDCRDNVIYAQEDFDKFKEAEHGR